MFRSAVPTQRLGGGAEIDGRRGGPARRRGRPFPRTGLRAARPLLTRRVTPPAAVPSGSEQSPKMAGIGGMRVGDAGQPVAAPGSARGPQWALGGRKLAKLLEELRSHSKAGTQLGTSMDFLFPICSVHGPSHHVSVGPGVVGCSFVDVILRLARNGVGVWGHMGAFIESDQMRNNRRAIEYAQRHGIIAERHKFCR